MNRRQFLERSLVALAAAQLGAAVAVSDAASLQATNFGFDIPSGATIDGIVCSWPDVGRKLDRRED
jgi:hypothetical protein